MARVNQRGVARCAKRGSAVRSCHLGARTRRPLIRPSSNSLLTGANYVTIATSPPPQIGQRLRVRALLVGDRLNATGVEAREQRVSGRVAAAVPEKSDALWDKPEFDSAHRVTLSEVP